MSKTAFTIYNASAGSGKTYTLVKEYIKILLLANEADTYRRILAITFTNKAVEEMKGRIISNLSDFARDEPSARGEALLTVLAQETGLSPVTIKDKSKSVIKHIIHNYASFDISTIDRFTHKVIRAFAHDLNLSVSFDVSLETENLLKEAVDAIIAKAGENEVLTALLVDFSLDKTDNDKSWDVTYELFETGKLLLNENHHEELGSFRDKTIEEFLFIKEKLKTAITELDAQSRGLGQQLNSLLEQEGVDPKWINHYFIKHLASIEAGSLNYSNKKYYEPEDISINKTAKNPQAVEGLKPALLTLLKKVYGNYEKKAFYEAFLKNITPLSLLNSIGQELERIQKDQNVLSISEFNAIIHKEIQSQPAPFIYERLGARYRHFFIDEFQDTSEMQWQNLIPLIDNALSQQDLQENKGSLMLVGDPKQSIYRWRGGRAEQFIELSKGHNPFSNPDRALQNLDTNYRSYSNVIGFNNDFFCFLAERFEQEDYCSLYRDNSRQNFNSREGGYVNITLLPENTADETGEEPDRNELYLQATLSTINQAVARGYAYGDIALLTRKRQPGILLANYLTEHGVPILSSETLLIENATEVKLIINLLRYLKSNENKEAKAHFLYFVANTQGQPDIHSFIAEGMEQDGEAALETWLGGNGVHISFRECRRKSLYEAVETIVEAFIKGKANQSYVQYFLDLVLERDIRTQSGISDFLEYWDNNGSKFSIPSPEGNDAVRILTVHKSKGLEFPVVIFPFAEEDYSRAPRNKMWLELDDETFGFQKALIDSNKSVAEYGERGAELYKIKEQEELLDNINILYVALTRAEEQLYIISARNFTAAGALTNNMSSYFISYLQDKGIYDNLQDEYSFGNPERLSEPHPHEGGQYTIEVVPQRFNPRAVKIAQREALMWGTRQQEAIAFGNVTHEILTYLNTAEDIDNALTRATEEGLIVQEQRGTVKQTLHKVVSHPELAAFFAEGNTIYNEQSIIAPGRQTLKPDRVAVKDGKAYLLDYKTGAHFAKYERQLSQYAAALQAMGMPVAKMVLVYIGDEVRVVQV